MGFTPHKMGLLSAKSVPSLRGPTPLLPLRAHPSLETAIRVMPEDVLGEFVKRRVLKGGKQGFYLDFAPIAGTQVETRIWSDKGTPFRGQKHAEAVVAAVLEDHKEKLAWEAIVSRYRGKRGKRDSVREWWAKYLEHKASERRSEAIGETYLAHVERIGRLHLLPCPTLKAKSIHSLSDGDLIEWMAWLVEKGLGSNSRLNCRQTFANLLHFIEHHHRRAGVPQWLAPKLPRVKVEDREVNVLTEEMQRAVIGSMKPRVRGVYLAMALSIRPGEARALLVSDYRDGGLVISKAVKGKHTDSSIGPPKTGRSRWIPLDESGHWAAAELIEWLAEFRSAEGLGPRLMFPGAHHALPLSHQTISKTWGRACKRAGVPHVTMYEGTRHTLASQLWELGARDTEIREILGHRPGTKSIESYRIIKQKIGTISTMSRFSRSARAPASEQS